MAEDKVLNEVKHAIENVRFLNRYGAYVETFQQDLHIKDGPLVNDNKLVVVSVALRFFS